jgi:DeoR family transcriptional regulator of aga operon
VHRAARLPAILEALAGQGSVDVAGLAEQLGVSAATVRRDLVQLERRRLLSRTRGGAVSSNVTYELPLRSRAGHAREEKRGIARAAIEHLGDARVVGLTGGTTTHEVARRLAESELTVVTNSISIAADLAVRPNLKLVVTGGVARAESYELVGPLAEATLAGLHLDVVFVGVDGVSSAGVSTHHEVEAHTNRSLIRRASRVVVVADASKLGRVAFAEICPLGDVDVLITDARVSAEQREELEAAGVEVVAA